MATTTAIKRLSLFCILAGAALLGAVQPVRAQSITTERVGIEETEAGNIVADAARAAGNAAIGFVPAAAFKPGASTAKPAGAAQIIGLVEPADDAVVVMSLRGAKVLEALEQSVSFHPQKSSGFLQVSGIRFRFDAGRPRGKRVTSVTVGGAPLEAAASYNVAMTRPLAGGQQGYFQIWERGNAARDTGKTLADAIRERAGSGKLSAPPEGRITSGG